MTILIRALLVSGLLALASSSSAQPAPKGAAEDVTGAKRLFEAGAKAYAAGDFEAALQAFDESYKRAPRSATVFSMAQAHKRQHRIDGRKEHLGKAVALYKRYLDEVPRGGRRADAVQALAELEALGERGAEAPAAAPARPPTRLMITSAAPGAEVSLDGGPFEDAPLIQTVEPGPHKVRVRARGFVEEVREVPVVEGAFVPSDVPLTEKPALLSISGPDGADVEVDGRAVGTLPMRGPLRMPAGVHSVAVLESGRRPWERDVRLERDSTTKVIAAPEVSSLRVASFVLLGAGGVGLLTGGVLGALALAREGDANDVLSAKESRQVQGAERDEYEAARAARDDLRTATIVAGGIGAGAALAGLALFVFDHPKPSRIPPPELRPSTGRRLGTFAVAHHPGGLGLRAGF